MNLRLKWGLPLLKQRMLFPHVLCPLLQGPPSLCTQSTDMWWPQTITWTNLSNSMLSLPPVHSKSPLGPISLCYPPLNKTNNVCHSTNTCVYATSGGQDSEGFSISLPISHILGTADSTAKTLSIVQTYSFSSSPQLYLPDCLGY